MNTLSVVIFFIWINYSTNLNINKRFSTQVHSWLSDDNGQPLFLTPFIKSGDLITVRNLSKVPCLTHGSDIHSHSGFITVNEGYNSNIFFWYFPPLNHDMNAPVILWLQGGPGTSGLFGVFVEHGPYIIDSNLRIGHREHSWVQYYHMIYVDNPVGTGFSFTEDKKGYVTSQEQMAGDLYEFLQQFFTLFDGLRRNDFYIAGESYAGKFVPSLAFKIHMEGPSSRLNLKGISVGNGLTDPETILDYSEYYYNLGIIDRKRASLMKRFTDASRQDILNHEYRKAYFEFMQMMDDRKRLVSSFDYMAEYTGYEYLSNFLFTKQPKNMVYFAKYVQFPSFKNAVHVGNQSFAHSDTVKNYLLDDFMKSVKSKVVVIMNNYKVLFYSGQLDLMVLYPNALKFLNSVQWKYADEYKTADRMVWKIDGKEDVAGYVHKVGDFYEVLVRNAGHFVSYDKPLEALDLITRFIKDNPFT